MGVLNVTPDSFSDGGAHLDPSAAVRAGLQMVMDGADILDIGGESTRPGSDPVDADEERERVVPVIKGLAAEVGVPLSIDTRKHQVAAATIEHGATIVNDVTAGSDPHMFRIAREAGAGLCLMHMRGEPKTMQQDTRYDDVTAEVKDYLAGRVRADVDERLEGTAGAVAWLAGQGAHVVRVHDVKAMTRVVRVVDAIRTAPDNA
jgi:dihydropteroate synthase